MTENTRTLDTLLKDFNISNPDLEMGTEGERPLEGLTFVITGSLPLDRKEVKSLIENMGGHAAGTVSKKTNYVVHGGSPGSKLEKARSLNIKTISYEELIKLIE